MSQYEFLISTQRIKNFVLQKFANMPGLWASNTIAKYIYFTKEETKSRHKIKESPLNLFNETTEPQA